MLIINTYRMTIVITKFSQMYGTFKYITINKEIRIRLKIKVENEILVRKKSMMID